ncbi:MAG TPA: hypothetical protein VJ781_07505 [Pyrinomonadaceae bacterium]|nr:hypothetical protein [Pyrinomonadaceae bacterium]
MPDIEKLKETDATLTDEEKRENAIRLAFNGNRERFEQFCRVLADNIPPNTAVVLGGSSITGHNHKDGRPFDADGPMTSDLDVTLVGPEAIEYFSLEGFWIPGIHSHPLKEGDDGIAPALKPLRHKLQAIAGGRPVTIQASRDFYYWIREQWLGTPYLTLVGKLEEEE